jgi:hypothetical protein
MMKDDQFYADMQRYIAVTTIGPSALRNQGAQGVLKIAQAHLTTTDLNRFRTTDESTFLHALDQATEELRRSFPCGAQNWGAARKALNLFLRDICYNRFLCERHGLSSAEEWMEIPLDSLVAGALKRRSRRAALPRWPGLNGLTAEVSFKFQTFAKGVANEEGISRVHLDMRLWTTERERIVKSEGKAVLRGPA